MPSAKFGNRSGGTGLEYARLKDHVSLINYVIKSCNLLIIPEGFEF